MSTVSRPKPLPPPDVPLLDPKTGKMSKAWYDYFKSLDQATGLLADAS